MRQKKYSRHRVMGWPSTTDNNTKLFHRKTCQKSKEDNYVVQYDLKPSHSVYTANRLKKSPLSKVKETLSAFVHNSLIADVSITEKKNKIRVSFSIWIRLIIRCLIMVSFSIFQNCQLCKEFTPHTGSCQGQILPPCFLFLCAAEALSELISLPISPNSLHSLKFCTNALCITQHKSSKEEKEITTYQHNELHNKYALMITVLIPPTCFSQSLFGLQ